MMRMENCTPRDFIIYAYFSPGKQRSTTYRRRREDWFLWNGGQSLHVCGKGLVNQKMSRDESECVVQKEQFTCPTAGTL